MFLNILLTISAGLMWTVAGIMYQKIAKWKLSVCNIGIATNLFTVFLMLILATDVKGIVQNRHEMPQISYVLFVAAAGFCSMVGALLMQGSMSCGKSSVSWAIGQSAFVVPFLLTTLIFHETWSIVKVLGTCLVVSGMIFLCRNKEEKQSAPERKKILQSLILAISAFAVIGIAQTMTGATSYFPYRDTANLRAVLLSAGGIAAALIGKIILHDGSFHIDRRAWFVIGVLALECAIGMIFQFLALDGLQKVGLNGIFYPLGIGTCIAAYSAYSLLILKEKSSKSMLAGMVLILLGVLAFCFSRT